MNVKKSAQTLLEYVILIGIVAMVATGMSTMLKRGIQSIVKATADQLAPQQGADQVANEEEAIEKGYLVESFTSRRTRLDRETEEFLGTTGQIYNDIEEVNMESTTNLGFTSNQN